MLTAAGFKRMRTADYLPVIQEQARELFGEDADLSDRTPLGKMIYLQAQQRAEDNEELEQIYNARFVDTSEGATLEANVMRALITRKRWLKSSGEVVLNLSKGAKVNAGDLFKTPYNVYFKALEAVQAVEDGNYRNTVEALEYGAVGNVEPGDISIIVNPQSGINSITNPDAFFNGQNEETDEKLQNRYYDSLGKVGARRIESIEGNILDEVEGVRSCIVIENDTDSVDADGRPPHSLETVVLGGQDGPIARKLLELKGGGIRAYGSTVVQVTDQKNKVHSIGFTRATTKSLYVRIYRKTSANFAFDGDEHLIKNTIEYIGGTYKGSIVFDGVGMSTDIILARLESKMFTVDGVVDVRVELSENGINYMQANVIIAFPEVAETDDSKIEVLPLE